MSNDMNDKKGSCVYMMLWFMSNGKPVVDNEKLQKPAKTRSSTCRVLWLTKKFTDFEPRRKQKCMQCQRFSGVFGMAVTNDIIGRACVKDIFV